MLLPTWRRVPTRARIKGVRQLFDATDDFEYALAVENTVASFAVNFESYVDKMQQIVHNVRCNPDLKAHGSKIISMTDAQMAENTIVHDIERESQRKTERFDQMLQDKFEQLNDSKYKTTLKCRRCGSDDVSWDSKQTRGADESMTIFCSCAKCFNRWKLS